MRRKHGLLLVLGVLRAQRIDAEGGGRSHGLSVLRLHVKLLAEWRNRSSRHPFGEVLVVKIRNVEDAQAALSHCGVQVLSTSLQVEDISIVVVSLFEFAIVLEVL